SAAPRRDLARLLERATRVAVSQPDAILTSEVRSGYQVARVILESGVELKRWSPHDFPAGSAGSRGECRFSPTCASPSGCPDLAAEYSEGVGTLSRPRYIAFCRLRAIARHGAAAVMPVNALEPEH